jgi:hypothetical protein
MYLRLLRAQRYKRISDSVPIPGVAPVLLVVGPVDLIRIITRKDTVQGVTLEGTDAAGTMLLEIDGPAIVPVGALTLGGVETGLSTVVDVHSVLLGELPKCLLDAGHVPSLVHLYDVSL